MDSTTATTEAGYEGRHRDDSPAAWSRQYRAASHVLVYGQRVARHSEATR